MTIKEVAKKFELTPDTLRFYEKEGLIGPIKKIHSGIRNYEENDLNRIQFVVCMRKAEVPIEILKEYIDLYNKGNETFEQRKELLSNQKKILKEKIKNMQKAYEQLNYKVNLFYEGKLDEYLEKTNV